MRSALTPRFRYYVHRFRVLPDLAASHAASFSYCSCCLVRALQLAVSLIAHCHSHITLAAFRWCAPPPSASRPSFDTVSLPIAFWHPSSPHTHHQQKHKSFKGHLIVLNLTLLVAFNTPPRTPGRPGLVTPYLEFTGIRSSQEFKSSNSSLSELTSTPFLLCRGAMSGAFCGPSEGLVHWAFSSIF